MVNVLDVLETIKSSSTTPKKIAETPKVQIEASDVEATKHQAETEAGPSEPAKVKSLGTIEKETKALEQILAEETSTATPEAFSEALNYTL
jgi:ribosomal protein L14E/L6E/L27E